MILAFYIPTKLKVPFSTRLELNDDGKKTKKIYFEESAKEVSDSDLLDD